MQKIVLILGPTGRLGRNAADAFERAGWTVRRFDRKRDSLEGATADVSVIVNGWNPPYHRWADEVPGQTADVIAAARACGATVILPGNLYVYGAGAPERFAPDTPHDAHNPLGRVRIEMEEAYRASGVQTFVVRAGDYLDTRASGNWFDMIIAKKAATGRISYPGPLDVPHEFTFLPDVAGTMVALAQRRETLGRFEDVPVPGFTLTGHELSMAVGQALQRDVRARRMSWLPIRLVSPFWPLGRRLLEMRYLWHKPHRLDAARHRELCPEVVPTPLDAALLRALDHQIHPDEAMGTGGKAVLAK